MVINLYLKCDICEKITNLKYQMGFINHHPIRFKCKCGVTLNGERNEKGIHFKNTKQLSTEEIKRLNLKQISQIISISPEFLTNPPSSVYDAFDTMPISPFIRTTIEIENYEEYRMEFQRILTYKSDGLQLVKNCNDLYEAKNKKALENVVRRDMRMSAQHFPMENDADELRIMLYVNQSQYMNEIGKDHLLQAQEIFSKAVKDHKYQVVGLALLLNRVGNLNRWQRDTVKLQQRIMDNIEYLLPVIGVNYYKSTNAILKSARVITTASFEDVKSLYVDLYEHICRTMGLVAGLDNIFTRGDFRILRNDSTNIFKGRVLEGLITESVHGKIVNYISDLEPCEKLIGKYLDKDVRNGIGHFSYDAHEVANTYGQIINFIDAKDKTKCTNRSLKEICYYIWQMYKSLAVIYELIYRFQILILGLKGITPSSLKIVGTNTELKSRTYRNMIKISPNDICPCGSGMKYKKCCGRRLN